MRQKEKRKALGEMNSKKRCIMCECAICTAHAVHGQKCAVLINKKEHSGRVLWCSGALVLWRSGALVLWCSGDPVIQ